MEATLDQVMGDTVLEEKKQTINNYDPLGPEKVVNGGIHPLIRETITPYKMLIDDLIM